MSELEKAMKVVTNAIKNDADYRHGWLANIAMSFQDVSAKYDGSVTDHVIANEAADNFLTLLCKDGESNNQS